MSADRSILFRRLERMIAARDRGLMGKLVHRPMEFFQGFFLSKVWHRMTGRDSLRTCSTFFKYQMALVLPAGLDIYLLGGKSHDAEIRLTKFMLASLQEGIYFDVGAHFGYYSCLASHLLDQKGQVMSFEPSRTTYKILLKSMEGLKNIRPVNMAMSNGAQLSFREYTMSHSEYNAVIATELNTFSNSDLAYVDYEVKSARLDEFIDIATGQSVFVKIDVEGGEFELMKGGVNFLTKHDPTIVMEYHLASSEQKIGCQKAAQLLFQMKYSAYEINDDGGISSITQDSIDEFLMIVGRTVDNIVFMKNK